MSQYKRSDWVFPPNPSTYEIDNMLRNLLKDDLFSFAQSTLHLTCVRKSMLKGTILDLVLVEMADARALPMSRAIPPVSLQAALDGLKAIMYKRRTQIQQAAPASVYHGGVGGSGGGGGGGGSGGGVAYPSAGGGAYASSYGYGSAYGGYGSTGGGGSAAPPSSSSSASASSSSYSMAFPGGSSSGGSAAHPLAAAWTHECFLCGIDVFQRRCPQCNVSAHDQCAKLVETFFGRKCLTCAMTTLFRGHLPGVSQVLPYGRMWGCAPLTMSAGGHSAMNGGGVFVFEPNRQTDLASKRLQTIRVPESRHAGPLYLVCACVRAFVSVLFVHAVAAAGKTFHACVRAAVLRRRRTHARAHRSTAVHAPCVRNGNQFAQRTAQPSNGFCRLNGMVQAVFTATSMTRPPSVPAKFFINNHPLPLSVTGIFTARRYPYLTHLHTLHGASQFLRLCLHQCSPRHATTVVVSATTVVVSVDGWLRLCRFCALHARRGFQTNT